MPRYCWKLAAASLWLCAVCFPTSAVSSVPFTIAQWRSDTISPQNAVLTAVITITQTHDGYLWLGTPDGLLRFDGARFTAFNEGNTPGLKSGSVVKLFEDSHSNFWIGTESGDVLMVKDGELHHLQVGRGTRESRLASICEDPSGAVWLYTADGYLGQYQNGKLTSWQVTANYQSTRRSMIVDSSGTLWIGTDFVLHRLRPNPVTSSNDVPTIAYSSMQIPELDFLLASRQGGYWRFADGRIQKWNEDRLVEGFDWPYPWNPKATPLRAACEDPDGNLIVGTGGEGVFWFDRDGKYHHLTMIESGLSSDTILSLCLDRQGDVWVGTDGQGLNRLRRKAFEVLEDSRNLTVQSVCNDGHDGLWIGYFGEHIDHWHDGKLDQFRRAEGLGYLGVKSVLVDHNQTLWVGTLLGGLLQFQEGRFAHAPGSDALTRNYDISALYEDRDNRLWAGTQAGLAYFSDGNWVFTNGVFGVVVRAILQDRSGNLWVGTQGNGLREFTDRQLLAFTTTNGLPSDNIACLYEDGNGVLWVGTSVGLASLHEGKWTSFAGHFSGASGNVSYLLDDDTGYLWMGSSVGLLRAKKADLNAFALGRLEWVPVRSYGQGDGLPTRVCSQGSQPAACRARGGKLWFPTISGLVSIDPAQLKPNTNPPPVIIESVLVDGKSVGPDALRAPHARSVVIPAARESLEIHYTSINLPAPDLGLIKYRLTPHEKDWATAEPQRRYARYPKLPHGHYTFELKACNEDGIWNDTPATLLVTVLPPFWQTWWFITGTSICLLALIVGSVHYVSTQKLQRQLATLRQQEALEKERARIARDLHDQLGANLTQVALLGEMAETDKDLPEEVEAHAKQISQTARETTRALDEIVWTVNPSNDTLDGLVNYICKYAQDYLAVAGLRYRLEVPPQLPSIPISPELRHNVFLATKESINNVVKHSGANSAWLRLRLDPDRFTLEIEDNGRGLPPDADKKGRNGLRNMRKRLEEIGGLFSITPGHEGGTIVALVVPLTPVGNGDTKMNSEQKGSSA